MTEDKGLKKDEGKNRLDLIPAHALDEIGKIFTFGSHKYADRNWEKGIKWSKLIGSLKRHLSAFEKGIDFDQESNLYHLSHLATNAIMLLEYYKIYPQGDDRPHHNRSLPKIGIDIDDVISDFIGHFCNTIGAERPNYWTMNGRMYEKLGELTTSKDFWLTIPPLTNPKLLPFEPSCYITARNIPEDWTREWIEKMGFPSVPIYSVGHDKSKVEAAIKANIDIFVDDSYNNFMELNKAGICTYLFDAVHNKNYDVGYKRITSLKELV